MLCDGIELVEGSGIGNLNAASGDTFPQAPDPGELFYKNNEGLHVYDGTIWLPVGAPPAKNLFNYLGDLQVQSSQARWFPPGITTIKKIEAWVSSGPVGGDIVVVIQKNLSPLHTITITAGQTIAVPATVSYGLTGSDFLTVNIVAVGNTSPGQNLTVRVTTR